MTRSSAVRSPLVWSSVFLLLISLLLTSCGRYHLGRHSEPPFRTIYIRPASNESFAPQIQAIVTQQLREEFIRDGLLEVTSEAEAHAVLEIVLRDFNREVAATRSEDTTLAAKLRLELTAFCTLTDNRSGEVYFNDRPVQASAQSFPQDRAQQEEYQAMPILAGEMARRISYEVLQVW